MFGYKHFKSDKNKRKKRGNVKKMVEENVIDGITAESIKKSADNCKIFIFYESCDVKISSNRTGHKLQNEKGSHKIGHHRSIKRKSQPEKGAERKIERI